MLDKYQELKKVYEDNGFRFKSFSSREYLIRDVFRDISEERYITTGGSTTIEELNLYDDFLRGGSKIHWHWKGQEPGSIKQDVYLTSSNAITRDGKLVNMDGNCNRVASMLYGFEDVVVVVGKNKIVDDYDKAIERIRNVAAPLNAKRLGIRTPCVESGKCMDCSSPDRICRGESIIHRNPNSTQIRIYLLDEDLGY